jgi:hypothetical protein
MRGEAMTSEGSGNWKNTPYSGDNLTDDNLT